MTTLADQVVSAVEGILNRVFGLGAQAGADAVAQPSYDAGRAQGRVEGAVEAVRQAVPQAHRIGYAQGARHAVGLAEEIAFARLAAAVAHVRATPTRVHLHEPKGEQEAELRRRVELAAASLDDLSDEDRERLRLGLVAECETWLAEHPDSPLARELYLALTGEEPPRQESAYDLARRRDPCHPAYRASPPLGSNR